MFAVTVQECELCKTCPVRDGGRLCEECMGSSAIAKDLPVCPHCHEPVKPNEEHPIRHGWQMEGSAPVLDVPETKFESRSLRRYRTWRKARNRMAARSRKTNRGR